MIQRLSAFLCSPDIDFKRLLEDCMAVVTDSIKEVREYLEEAGADVSGMTEEELEEASEVFALSGGRYLIVEG